MHQSSNHLPLSLPFPSGGQICGLTIDHKRLVAPLEHMPSLAAASVPALRENTEDPFHSGHQVRLQCFQEEIEMIVHPDSAMQPLVEAAMRFTYQNRPCVAILVVIEDILTAVPTCHEGIDRPCRHINGFAIKHFCSSLKAGVNV